MAIILNIDTATGSGSITLAKEGIGMGTLRNDSQKDHAAWVQAAIRGLVQEAGLKMTDLQAVAITAGPGSYTGLRVGMATAKGLCYALSIPLIAENTLKVMAYAGREQFFASGSRPEATSHPGQLSTLFCPMIDARRMEVFTGLYDLDLDEIMPPAALILEKSSFNKELENNSILFLGNGSAKWKPLCDGRPHAGFVDVEHSAEHLAPLAERAFIQENFANLAYEEPVYLKEFYSYIKK